MEVPFRFCRYSPSNGHSGIQWSGSSRTGAQTLALLWLFAPHLEQENSGSLLNLARCRLSVTAHILALLPVMTKSPFRDVLSILLPSPYHIPFGGKWVKMSSERPGDERQ